MSRPEHGGLKRKALTLLLEAEKAGELVGYLAPEGRERELLDELGEKPLARAGRLFITPGPPRTLAWVSNRWLAPKILPITSVGNAATQLRELQRNWWPYSAWLHRRTALIHEALPHVAARPLAFPELPPETPLGSFTLLDENTLFASPTCDSPVPNGEYRFIEDHEGPPSRAYLKLWEALTRLRQHPGPGDHCLDLGASPGGFTWVCQNLGARVTSIDKAPLAESIAQLPRIEHRLESAFALHPERFGPVDWLLSDVICHPDRLLGLVERWIASGNALRIVATIKLKGPSIPESVQRFQQIPGGRVVHLFHNKHELTFLYERDLTGLPTRSRPEIELGR